jgi:type IVB pilus formation R64 PilN family outer membrane protein
VSSLVREVGQTGQGVMASSSVTYKDDIWVGKGIAKSERTLLPPIFSQPATFDRTVHSLTEVAERITLRSGIPTKVSAEALQASQGGNRQNVPAAAPVQVAAPVSTTTPPPASGAIRIAYTDGNFKGLLDTIAARFGVFWKYANGTLDFYFTDTRTFQINAIPGDASLSASVVSSAGSGGAGGGGGEGDSGGASASISSSNSQNTNVQSALSVFSNIEKALSIMLSPYGKVVASPATGTITVTDTPETLERVAQFIEQENKALSRQVLINVTVLAVTMNEEDSYGIKWNLVYNGLRNYGIRTASIDAPAPADSTSFSAAIISADSRWENTALIIEALSRQGKVRRETTASVVTLNNQPVPVQVARQTNYLKSSQTTLGALGGSTTTFTPGTVTAGFNMTVLPHILNNGTVMLQFSTDISALVGLERRDVGTSSIQLPVIDTRNFLQRVAMKSNETLIISGYEQINDNLTRHGAGHPRNPVFGGGYNATGSKEVIVVLITPVVRSAQAVL